MNFAKAARAELTAAHNATSSASAARHLLWYGAFTRMADPKAVARARAERYAERIEAAKERRTK